MTQPRAVFVVGHSNWGKSRTLRALTDGNAHRRYVQLRGVEFFIRRMSNDDRPDEFYAFVNSLRPSHTPQLIAAFCPSFGDPRAQRCLDHLVHHGYGLFFWVMRRAYLAARVVTADEIGRLRASGTVEIYDRGDAEDGVRATALRQFVENSVLGN